MSIFGLKFRKYSTTAIMIAISITIFIPFYIMVIMGSYKTEDLFKGIPLLPGNYVVENFMNVIKSGFLGYYKNSLIVSATAVMGSVLISAMAGYSFAKFKYREKNALYAFVMAILMIPSELGMVAYIIEMRYLGLNGTLLPLIFPWFSSAFGVFWMRQYISSSVPNEVLESARIDGSTEGGVFFKIVLPYIRPAIFTLILLILLWSWNNYLLPLCIVNNPDNYTIPLGIQKLATYYRTDHAAKIMGLTMGTIPIMLIFIFGSKYFIAGLTSGAVKG